MTGNIGVFLALALLIVLALRGVNIFVASLAAVMVAALTNGQSLVEALTTHYTRGMVGFAGLYYLLFFTGAIFGRVMGETNAATSIASWFSRKMGEHRAVYIAAIACAILTYGGVNVFIVVFTVYPLGLILMKRANMPKRIFLGAVMLGSGTFTMTAMPWSPSVHNLIAASKLGTATGAGWALGLPASAIMIVLGLWYLERERKRARVRGEQFHAAPSDVIPEHEPDPSALPSAGLATLPLAAVLGTIMLPLVAAKFVTPQADGAATAPGASLPALLQFAQKEQVLWTCLALVIGTLLALVMFRRFVPRPLATVSRGAESAVLPLMNTAAVIGFGSVIKTTPIFSAFAHLMIDSGINPLVSAAIAINLMAGIVGSASGGLGIFFDTLGPHYLAAGVRPETLHRIVTIGSGGLDSLPHCGAVITMLTVMGLTHKEAYKDSFAVTVVIPLIALAAVLGVTLLLA